MDLSSLSALEIRAMELAEADGSMLYQLVRVRITSGLTQAEVGKRMGITQPSVAAFESYDNDPKLSTIQRYALAVGARITHTVEVAPSGAGHK